MRLCTVLQRATAAPKTASCCEQNTAFYQIAELNDGFYFGTVGRIHPALTHFGIEQKRALSR